MPSSARKNKLYTMVGSVFMLVSIIALAFTAKAGDGGTVTFDLVKIANSGNVPTGLAGALMFFGFMAAFAVKTPVFPFHTWLPDAHTEAPTAGSVDLAGVFFLNDTATSEIYTLSLHDALPI